MKKSNVGFTLIEVLVVVGLIVIILVIALAQFGPARARARDNVRQAHIQEIRLAVEEYKAVCGEYPARLDPETNNGDCPTGVSLENFLPEVPEAPSQSADPYSSSGYYSSSGPSGVSYNGYYYAGLSTRSNGPCFEYHLGVPIESGYDSATQTFSTEGILADDHDCGQHEGIYDNLCPTSTQDFSGANDTTEGIYDFRGANTCGS